MTESNATAAMGLPKDYDEAVRQRDAWYDTAEQMCGNADYYRGLLVQIGKMFGREAQIADDGSDMGNVLVAKVPELVRAALPGLKDRVAAGLEGAVVLLEDEAEKLDRQQETETARGIDLAVNVLRCAIHARTEAEIRTALLALRLLSDAATHRAAPTTPAPSRRRTEEEKMSEMTNDDLLRALMHAVENDCDSGADTYSEKVKDARAAVLARMVPAGWKAVPAEPTKEMRAAFHAAHERWENGRGLDSPDHQWGAMLAATPASP